MSQQQKQEISVITPTADREFCLNRLTFYLKRQTFIGDIQWIISDSGSKSAISTSLPFSFNTIEYKYLEYIKDSKQSFCKNMQDALSRVKYKKVLVMEDDDWYHPTYIEVMCERLHRKDLIGEIPAIYYHIKDKSYRILPNTERASMCQMGFTEKVIPIIQHIIKQDSSNAFIDLKLWKYYSSQFKRQLYNSRLSIGIKGMPGNPGIGIGHRIKDVHRKSDPDFRKLEKWIGKEDTDFYREIYK